MTSTSAPLLSATGRPLVGSSFAGTVSIEGEQKIPALWPGGSLAQFGKTESGTNIWRVVWSESVNHLFGARWMDTGFVGYRYIPTYMGKKCYVLERFLTPYQYDKCTEEIWNRRHKDPDTGLAQLDHTQPTEHTTVRLGVRRLSHAGRSRSGNRNYDALRRHP